MTKRSIKTHMRINKIQNQLESLNTITGERYELGYRGRNHRICLLDSGYPVAYGLKAIEEHIYWLNYYKG